MSHQLGRAVSEILNRYFGEIVQKVGNDLFSYGSKPITLIIKTTGLPRNQVVDSLRTLIKYDLASFEPSVNEVTADYKLLPDNVLLLIRYPRYLLQMKTKYGSEAELLVEELLQRAICTATTLLVTVANKYKDDKEKNVSLVRLKDTFVSLATAGYIAQAPVAEGSGPVPVMEPVATIVPELDVRTLMRVMADPTQDNDNVYWKVNYDRFHQDFRDELMIKAMTRRIDENAGELMRLMLEQMYLTSPPWAPESNPISLADLKDACRRCTDKPLLQQHLEHYVKVIEENGGEGVGEWWRSAGGGGAVRAARGAGALAAAAAASLVAARLGTHAARIFRLIQSKKYMEEGDIQKHAMLPNKECKELTYKLLEEHFISVQPMRKAASAGGMAKAIFLYHVKLRDVCSMCMEMCYRCLANCVCAGAGVRGGAARLLAKRRRVRSLAHSLRLRGEPQAHIDDVEETLTPPELAVIQDVEKTLKQLSIAEMELDRTLFIFKWYFSYPYSE